MQVGWVERKEHVRPSLLSSTGIRETSESDGIVIINQVMDLLWKTVPAHTGHMIPGVSWAPLSHCGCRLEIPS